MTDNVVNLPLHSGQPLPAREDRDWVTAGEITDHAGITYRQLDYWTRTGLLTPITTRSPGSGWLRRYAEDQAARARTIRLLLDAGVSLQVIREHLDQVLEHGHFDHGPVRITILDATQESA